MSQRIDISQSEDHDSRQSSVFEPPEYKIFYGPDHTLHWEPTAGSAELAVILSYYFPLEKDLASKMRAATIKFLKSQPKNRFKHGEAQSSFQKQAMGSNATPQISSSITTQAIEGSRRSISPSVSLGQVPMETYSPSADDNSSTLSQCQNGQPSALIDSYSQLNNDLGGIGSLSQPGERDTIGTNETNVDSFRILSWSLEGIPSGKRRKKRPYEKGEKARVAANRGHVCEAHRRRKAKCDPARCPSNRQNRKPVESRPEDQKSMAKAKAEPPKPAPNLGISSLMRNWAPEELVCRSDSPKSDYNENSSSQTITSSSTSSTLGPPWGPRNANLSHAIYSPIWQLPWGYNDGGSWVMSPLPNNKLPKNPKDSIEDLFRQHEGNNYI